MVLRGARSVNPVGLGLTRLGLEGPHAGVADNRLSEVSQIHMETQPLKDSQEQTTTEISQQNKTRLSPVVTCASKSGPAPPDHHKLRPCMEQIARKVGARKVHNGTSRLMQIDLLSRYPKTKIRNSLGASQVMKLGKILTCKRCLGSTF